jgi:hypothetical protein
MAIWYSCKIQYLKQFDGDKMKIVSEEFLIDAVSFTDAEARMYKCISDTVKDFNIASVRKTNIKDVFNYDDSEIWYRCKMSYLSIDDSNGKEKRTNSYMLVSADNPKQAYERLQESLASMIVPFDITDVNLTTILDVFPYVADEDKVPENFKPIGEPRLKKENAKENFGVVEEVKENFTSSDRDLEIITEEEISEEEAEALIKAGAAETAE